MSKKRFLVTGWASTPGRDYRIKLVVSVKDKRQAADEALNRAMQAIGVVGATWKRTPDISSYTGV